MKQANSPANGRFQEDWAQGEDREWTEFSKEIRGLVQQLVGRMAEHDGAPPADPEDKVILDVEVDGVRCVLVRRPPEPGRIDAPLSPREHEIARMVAKGYPNKVMARVLEISTWTVSTHLRRIFAKLGVSSRAAMVAHLLEEGQMEKGSHMDRR